MKILKSKDFTGNDALTIFVNDNNIAREDILAINCSGEYTLARFTLFFYADLEVKEKERNMWGKLKD